MASQLNLPHGTKNGKKLEDAARKYQVMAALPNVRVEKTARRSQQLQGQRIRSLAVMVRIKRRSQTHLF